MVHGARCWILLIGLVAALGGCQTASVQHNIPDTPRSVVFFVVDKSDYCGAPYVSIARMTDKGYYNYTASDSKYFESFDPTPLRRMELPEGDYVINGITCGRTIYKPMGISKQAGIARFKVKPGEVVNIGAIGKTELPGVRWFDRTLLKQIRPMNTYELEALKERHPQEAARMVTRLMTAETRSPEDTKKWNCLMKWAKEGKREPADLANFHKKCPIF